ncbi:hypothetical protein VTL71DRAFT_2680 [Oculimacula yallundae]|uniref:Secreted protein n=1 Tax=Oculimacula yallundae TaxID=86028 RepID=A0ABR4C9J5_9HELO
MRRERKTACEISFLASYTASLFVASPSYPNSPSSLSYSRALTPAMKGKTNRRKVFWLHSVHPRKMMTRFRVASREHSSISAAQWRPGVCCVVQLWMDDD